MPLSTQVCHSKVEELQLPDDERVDVLVSEPMGTLLVNERMLETYLYARDHFLKPGGKMFPVGVAVCEGQ
jgi:histone-arginine methyltransferase CARM1